MLTTNAHETTELLQLDVCLLSGERHPGPLLDHVSSTLVAGVRISTATSLDSVEADVIWLEGPGGNGPEVGREVLQAAERGALVIIHDPTVLGVNPVSVPLTRGRFPSVNARLKPLQALLAQLLGVVDEEHFPLLFGRAETASANVTGGESLVEGDEGTWCGLVRCGRGEVLWLGLLPSLDGAGFRVESHTPLRSAACQLLVDETLAYAFQRKHGVSVRKLFGPYGAPMMAWQAHFEEIGGLWNKSMEHFVARLANSRQAPTFSVIRQMIRWGRRVPGLVHLPWAIGTEDAVRGQPDGPALFSGQWITLSDGAELGFPAGDGYVEYHKMIPGQPRIYPAPVPGSGLALGTPDGQIELFSVSLRDGRVSLTRQGPLTLADGTVLHVPGAAAPTFGSTRGRRILVIADDGGALHVYVESESGWTERERYALDARVSPRLVDWTGSGTLDLMIGTEDGAVDLFEDFEQAGLARRRTLFQTESARVAPWPVASGRQPRVFFGDLRGRLWVWQGGTAAMLPSRDCTMAGPTEIFLQQDAVPVLIDVDGRELLIVGASIVGNPQTIDDPRVPATGALQEILVRLRKSRTPCNPHLFLHQSSSLEEVSAELSRHRASFAALGLAWEGTGANQHGWWVPRNDTARGFLLQRTAGLCFNFGWQSPGTRGAPDFDVKYALSFPFLLRRERVATDFVLHAPVLPDRYPRALELMAAAGLPMAFFVHPEYRREGPGALEADRWIGAVEEIRRRHGCVFVTENQMAKTIAVTLTSEVRVVRTSSGELRLEADTSAIPPWADEYRRTLAVGIEWPEHAPTALSSDGVASSVRGRRFITTVDDRTTIRVGDGTGPAWQVRAANGPIELADDGIDVLAPGFQELHVSGQGLQVEWPGAHLRDTGDGLVLTRFGECGRVRVRTQPSGSSRADAGVEWSPHESKQDRWVIENVFRGRATPGFFVETGVADGVSTSSTLALERSFGWTGIVVEPNRIFFEQLRRNRRCRVENACIAEHSGTVDFIEASWFGRIQEHFREGHPERDHLQDPYLTHDIDGSPAKVVQMPALSLEDLLRRHDAPTRIDFMSIDAEFSEWFILKSFPFDRFEVLALCTRSKFRHADTLVDGKHAEDIRRVLCDLGYFYDREYSRHVQYDFFVHPNVIEHPLPDPAVRGGA